MAHWISGTCQGELCRVCKIDSGIEKAATHKMGEEIPVDDPIPNRHNLTVYVCCLHFRMILGPAVPCKVDEDYQGSSS